MSDSPVHLTRLPPERGRPAGVTTYCGACCCCCCCCLHSLGGLIGAAVAPAIRTGPASSFGAYYDEETGTTVPDVRRAGVSGVVLFWWFFLATLLVGFLVGVGMGDTGSYLVTVIVLLLLMPGLQLAAAILALIVLAFWPRPDKSYQLIQLGKILLGIVVGTVLGLGSMFAISLLFLHR